MNDDNERDYNEYDFDPSITEHEGFSIGDQVILIVDTEFNSEEDEGQVVGFSVIPPAEDPAMALAFGNDPHGRTAIYVLMDGSHEPVEVRPHEMEAV